VSDTVAAVLVAASIVLALWALVLVVRGRPLDDPLFYGLASLEAALVALLIGGSIALARTDREVDGFAFVGYLLTSLIILPVAVVWAVAEKSRWGTSVLVIGCLVIAIMVVRMQQIWSGAGA
jgi:hypothetical protein